MPASASDRLDSWKEIAAYLNRGVRTVRRWEAEEGLPVHRQIHRTLGSVYAFKSEIDAWRASPARAGARAPALTPTPSIAVLPFASLSTDPENELFADGLTDEITSDLSTVGALRVTSRTSSRTFKGTTKDLKRIAGELGVRYVLEGSVRRTGDRLRITAQLIDAKTDEHVWADKYEGTAGDVFAIQEGLARTIVEALKIQLTPDEHLRLAERPIDDLQAYECYLRARQGSWRWRKDAIDHAIVQLRNGLEIVGDNARLHAAMGLAYLQYREAGIDIGSDPVEAAEGCARAVFALQPRSAAGLQLRGWIHYARGRVQEAVRDLKAALELDPSSADTLLLLSNCYLISGRVAAARPVIDRLVSIDPLTPVTRCMPAFADALDGKLEAAIQPYRQMFEMDRANPMALLFYVWILTANRRDGEVAALMTAIPQEIRNSVPSRIAAFLAHATAGEHAEAVACVTPDVEAAAAGPDVFPRLLAQGFALAGMSERAMHWLEIAVDRGFINYPFLTRHDPFFAGMRQHPGFVRLMETVGERWERFEA